MVSLFSSSLSFSELMNFIQRLTSKEWQCVVAFGYFFPIYRHFVVELVIIILVDGQLSLELAMKFYSLGSFSTLLLRPYWPFFYEQS